VKINEELVRSVRLNNTEFTLVGTAHVSRKSVEKVEQMIRSGGFDCVAVELCQARHNNLVNKDWWKNLDIFQIFKQRRATLLLINLALTAYQKRLAEKLGVDAGKEMQRAVELASENNLRLETIDRDISTTLQRIIRRVSFWQKIKLFVGLISSVFIGEEITEEQVEELKQGDLLHSVVEEFGEQLPAVKETLIDERDQYMAGKLAAIAEMESAPKNVVVVIGAGHLPGMLSILDAAPVVVRLEELEVKPPPSRLGYFIGWGIAVLVLSMFFFGYRQSPELGWQLIVTWVVLNGGLSAFGAALALAHPLSIVSAFLAAPITSLNPTIGAGMVVGLVESFLRKPKVEDFENLREDVVHLKKWWQNRVVRVFLIFFFANMGSAIGTWVAGASIVNQILG
tara:strand:- start:289 stop:1479 length:1191 start_codon:yes stop_codon:yes gene_type:complete